jgi:hypothetical protein
MLLLEATDRFGAVLADCRQIAVSRVLVCVVFV